MKYTLYWWDTDDEGGYGICPSDEIRLDAKLIGHFNTVSELGALLYADDPEWFFDEPGADMFAMEMMRSYKEREV